MWYTNWFESFTSCLKPEQANRLTFSFCYCRLFVAIGDHGNLSGFFVLNEAFVSYKLVDKSEALLHFNSKYFLLHRTIMDPVSAMQRLFPPHFNTSVVQSHISQPLTVLSENRHSTYCFGCNRRLKIFLYTFTKEGTISCQESHIGPSLGLVSFVNREILLTAVLAEKSIFLRAERE